MKGWYDSKCSFFLTDPHFLFWNTIPRTPLEISSCRLARTHRIEHTRCLILSQSVGTGCGHIGRT